LSIFRARQAERRMCVLTEVAKVSSVEGKSAGHLPRNSTHLGDGQAIFG
jgi:hypothetical protein